jgi:hypothetical protein
MRYIRADETDVVRAKRPWWTIVDVFFASGKENLV